jgi:actin-related protein 5
LALLVSQQEEPSFPLVDVPDADVRKVSSLSQGLSLLTRHLQLDEEGLKEKKKQKLLKAGLEARARARREKEREKEEKEREEKREEEEREMDLAGWSRKLRREQGVGGMWWLVLHLD